MNFIAKNIISVLETGIATFPKQAIFWQFDGTEACDNRFILAKN